MATKDSSSGLCPSTEETVDENLASSNDSPSISPFQTSTLRARLTNVTLVEVFRDEDGESDFVAVETENGFCIRHKSNLTGAGWSVAAAVGVDDSADVGPAGGVLIKDILTAAPDVEDLRTINVVKSKKQAGRLFTVNKCTTSSGNKVRVLLVDNSAKIVVRDEEEEKNE